jgi:hypothetical protein
MKEGIMKKVALFLLLVSTIFCTWEAYVCVLAAYAYNVGFLQINTTEDYFTGTQYGVSVGPDDCYIGIQTGPYGGLSGSCPPAWEFGPKPFSIPPDPQG